MVSNKNLQRAYLVLLFDLNSSTGGQKYQGTRQQPRERLEEPVGSILNLLCQGHGKDACGCPGHGVNR